MPQQRAPGRRLCPHAFTRHAPTPLSLRFVLQVGDVPLEWYRHEEHIGYNVEGQKIEKGPRRDRLDKLIAKQDSGKVGAGAAS